MALLIAVDFKKNHWNRAWDHLFRGAVSLSQKNGPMQSGWTAPSQAYPYCSLHVSPGFAGLWRSMSRLLRGVCARFMRSHSLLRSASTGMSKASNLVPGVPDEFKNNWHSDESTIEGVANKPSKEIVLSVEELKRATETCFEVSNNAQAPDF